MLKRKTEVFLLNSFPLAGEFFQQKNPELFKFRAFSNKKLPREDSNLGPSGYDLTPVTRRVGLSLRPDQSP